MATAGPKPSVWRDFQQMALRYKALPPDSDERLSLREHMARQIMGVYMVCLTEADCDDGGAQLSRRNSALENLFRQELRRHGEATLPLTHGGIDAFVPVAAQAFLLERQLRPPAGVTFLSALLYGWDGKGSVQAFMRSCVRNFLADMANARKPAKRTTGARMKPGTGAAEAERLQQRHEVRKRLLRGEAAPLEEASFAGRAPGGDGDGDDMEGAEFDPGDIHDVRVDAPSGPAHELALNRLRRQMRDWAESVDVDPLDKAIIGQLMGWDEELEWGALAKRFGVSPARVAQRKARIEQRAGVLAGLA